MRLAGSHPPDANGPHGSPALRDREGCADRTSWIRTGVCFIEFLLIVLATREAGPAIMEERRKHQRTELNEPAFVSAGGSVMSCVVRNISTAGAAIEVENPAFVPAQFRLVMANGAS